MKRELSDSETDDLFDDGLDKTSSSVGGNSCQMFNRKKRRGIIEKKRRDRINNSLSELRRLVPVAFEKQGSAKLEKAEILQMTVDHLKTLHAKGFDAFSFDPHKFANDYHGVGFRECAAEVARYLVSVEGLDIQDPLRLRLMSHLQCFSTQRDHLPTKTPSSSPLGQSMAWNQTSQFGPPPTSTSTISPLPPPLTVHHNVHMNPSSTLDAMCYDQGRFQDVNSSGAGFSHHHQMRIPSPPTHGLHTLQSMTIAAGSSPTNQSHLLNHHHHHLAVQSQYPVHLSSNSHHGGLAPLSPTSYSQSSSSTTAQVKPYRPWGTEMAY